MGCTVYLCGARLKTSPLIDIPVTLSNNGASNFLEIDVCPPQGKTLLLALTDPWMIYTCTVALSVCVCVCVRVCVAVRNCKNGLLLAIAACLCMCVCRKASMQLSCLCAANSRPSAFVILSVSVCYLQVYISVIILFSELLLANLLFVRCLFPCPLRWT